MLEKVSLHLPPIYVSLENGNPRKVLVPFFSGFSQHFIPLVVRAVLVIIERGVS